jgi:DNA polymerase-3 subunit gamma/tau
MARTKNPAPGPARSAADTAPDPAPAPVTPPAGDSPAAAVLAALTAEPGGATVAVIAGRAQITAAAARQALAAHEKAGTATRVKGGRPGIPDTWKPAGQAGPGPAPEPDGQPGAAGPEAARRDQAPPAQAPGTDHPEEPAAEGAGRPAETGQPASHPR